MIRKSLLAAITLMLLASQVMAKKEKTIAHQDTLSTDTQYGYSFKVNENWKVRDFKVPSVERAFLEKKNYSINREVQSFGGDYTIPTIVIFAQEFSGTLDDFEALLRKSLDEHQSDNEIIRKLGLLRDSDYIISNKTFIDSLPTRQILLKRNYKRLLSANPYTSDTQADRQTERYVNDHEVHEIYAIKKGDALIVLQAYCEREFYAKENKDEFGQIANSLDFFNPPPEAAQGDN
jgi:hypothetical protein